MIPLPTVEAQRIHDKTLACVHCGLCLPACPAYENAPRESLAPRGQVFIARALLEGRLEAGPGLAEDLYECLACRGCETVCPAGVEVGAIVEGVRGLLDEARVEPWQTRLLKRVVLGGIVARPRVLRLAMELLRLVERLGLRRLARPLLRRAAPGLAARERLLPELPPRDRLPATTPARRGGGGERGTVALFLGCVAPHLRPETARSAVEALSRNGWEVVIPDEQGCCGALHLHAGLPDIARRLARQNLRAFSGAAPVITTAAGCGAALHEVGELLPDEEAAGDLGRRIRDISSFLVGTGFEAPTVGPAPGRTRTVYDAPCHLFHAQQVKDEPIEILRRLPGVELVAVRDPERCCGSAGIYNVTRHETSMAVLDRKMAHIAPAAPDLIATGNIGCQLQLAEGARRAGLGAEVAHPVELLAAAYRRGDAGSGS